MAFQSIDVEGETAEACGADSDQQESLFESELLLPAEKKNYKTAVSTLWTHLGLPE